MLTRQVYKGTRSGLTAVFRDGLTEAVGDPTAVSVKTESPSGTITTYVYGVASEVTKLSTGTYRFSFLPNSAGDWFIYGIGAGGLDVVGREKLTVLDTPF